eukprot:1095572-Rhodomonas_salina.2
MRKGGLGHELVQFAALRQYRTWPRMRLGQYRTWPRIRLGQYWTWPRMRVGQYFGHGLGQD